MTPKIRLVLALRFTVLQVLPMYVHSIYVDRQVP